MLSQTELLPLALDNPRWAELKHAYGGASDIPGLVRQLENIPPAVGDSEPWHSLWSALAHQGDVYSASFAAVPHVVGAIASAPLRVDAGYFQFVGVVELCRQQTGTEIPGDLRATYYAALAQLPALAAQAADRKWDDDFLRSVLSSIAAAKGAASLAEAILELTPEVARQFLDGPELQQG